jgi:Holliday junction resolvasome RuvABC endonuclease subunit
VGSTTGTPSRGIEEAAKRETDRVVELLQSNTVLTQQDKDVTEQVAKLTREIHALLTQQRGS